MIEVTIVYLHQADAQEYLEEGYCLVESTADGLYCTATSKPGIDRRAFVLDPPGVVEAAYSSYFGVLRPFPKVVMVGPASARATFAVACLLGKVPHKDRKDEFAQAPTELQKRMTRDFSELAKLLGRAYVYSGFRRERSGNEELVDLWQQFMGDHGWGDSLACNFGVGLWQSLLCSLGSDGPFTNLLKKAVAELEDAGLKEALVERFPEGVVMVDADLWGCDVTFSEVGATIVVTFSKAQGYARVQCWSDSFAEESFGVGGLLNVYPQLPEGWGGGKCIGASPQHRSVTYEEVSAACCTIANLVKKS
jgi:hypothetical protein